MPVPNEILRMLQHDMVAVEQLHESDGKPGSPRMEVPTGTMRKLLESLTPAPKHGWLRLQVNGNDWVDPDEKGAIMLGTEVGSEVVLHIRMPGIKKATKLTVKSDGTISLCAEDPQALPMANT